MRGMIPVVIFGFVVLLIRRSSPGQLQIVQFLSVIQAARVVFVCVNSIAQTGAKHYVAFNWRLVRVEKSSLGRMVPKGVCVVVGWGLGGL
jgi:hypothetical protein